MSIVRGERPLSVSNLIMFWGVLKINKPRSTALGANLTGQDGLCPVRYEEMDYIKWLNAMVLGGTSVSACSMTVEQ